MKAVSRGRHVNVTIPFVRAAVESVQDPLKENARVMDVVASMNQRLDCNTMEHSVTAAPTNSHAETPRTLRWYAEPMHASV